MTVAMHQFQAMVWNARLLDFCWQHQAQGWCIIGAMDLDLCAGCWRL